MFLFTAVTYWALRNFGAAAQAAFGIGGRIMQGIFLPVMAIAFAAAPVAGQNFGARQPERVRETFRSAVKLCTALMFVLMLLCQWRPDVLIGFFSKEPEVIEIGSQFLHIISLNFVLSGVVFTCSSMFQALGNTLPSLYSSATRLITYSVPLIWISTQPWFQSGSRLVPVGRDGCAADDRQLRAGAEADAHAAQRARPDSSAG